MGTLIAQLANARTPAGLVLAALLLLAAAGLATGAARAVRS